MPTKPRLCPDRCSIISAWPLLKTELSSRITARERRSERASRIVRRFRALHSHSIDHGCTQQCTQYVTALTASIFPLSANRRRWGYFISGSDIPQNVRTFLSRVYTMEYSTLPCRTNFKHHEPSPSRFHQQVWTQELQFPLSRGLSMTDKIPGEQHRTRSAPIKVANPPLPSHTFK